MAGYTLAARVFVLLTTAHLLALGARRATADGCPTHSHPVRQEDQGGTTKVFCRCDTGYAKLDGSCELVAKARAVLARRHRDALNGLQNSLTAFANDLVAAGLTRMRDRIQSDILSHLATAIVAPEPKIAAISTLVLVRFTLFADEAAGQVRECRFDSEDLRTSCGNANNFKNIAEKSLKEFEATFKADDK
jgi:hypothetical protein